MRSLLFIALWLELWAQIDVIVKIQPNIAPYYYDSAFAVRYWQQLKAVRPITSQWRDHPIAQWFCITFNAKDTVNVLRQIQQHPHVLQWEWNYKRQLHQATTSLLPNDYYLQLIKAPQAWTYTQGANVKVGIIDTGIDYNHPQLRNRLWFNASEDLNQNGTFEPWPHNELRNGMYGDLNFQDDDGNGYVDDVIGFDFVHQPERLGGGDYLFEDADPYDDNSHGTIVASVLTSVAPQVQIVAIRAFAAMGIGEDDDIARAIVYAAENQVAVLNMSFGDIYPSAMVRDAVQYAQSRGVVLVASAGNGTGNRINYPAAFPEVIAVSASDYNPETQQEYLWFLSSYGETIDLCAPGSNIYAAFPVDSQGNTSYGYVSGTSVAAPQVSAAAALIKSLQPQLSPQHIRTLLNTYADDIESPGWDPYTGNGRLNCLTPLKYPYPAALIIHSPIQLTQQQTPIIVTAYHPLFQKLQLYWNDYLIFTSYQQHYHDTLLWLSTDTLKEGNYLLRLQLHLTNGKVLVKQQSYDFYTTPPQPENYFTTWMWDLDRRVYTLVGSSSQKSFASLIVNGKSISYDKIGYYYLIRYNPTHPETLYTQLHLRNLSGLDTLIFLDTIAAVPYAIPKSGVSKVTSLPFAYYAIAYDLNQDGIAELIASEYTEQGNYGPVIVLQQQGNTWKVVSRFAQHYALIPRAIADYDNDNLLDLLCTINDSIIILTQSLTNPFEWEWKVLLPLRYYAATFADADQDGTIEIFAKDFRHYYVIHPQTFAIEATLADTTSDYLGSTAPSVAIADFDGDTKTEIAFLDYDGDLHIYEASAKDRYRLEKVLSTSLIGMATTLQSANIDNDPLPEIVFALRTSELRDEQRFDYYPPYVKIHVVEFQGDYQITQQWWFYNYNSLRWNALALEDVDKDQRAEVLFVLFPRFYLFDFDGLRYRARYFDYGHFAQRIQTYNGQWISCMEDSCYFFQLTHPWFALQAPAYLEGYLSAATTARLYWQAVPDAQRYIVWRGFLQDSIIYAIDTTLNPSYVDIQLLLDTTYLYTVTAYHPDSTPSMSAFAPALVLKTHIPVVLDSVIVKRPYQLLLKFSQPIPYEVPLYWFWVDTLWYPISVVYTGEKQLLLTFDSLPPGTHVLCVDTLFTDLWGARIQPNQRCKSFVITLPTHQRGIYLQRWERLNDFEVVLYFNRDLDSQSLSLANFQLKTPGDIAAISFAEGRCCVRIRFAQPLLAPLGRPAVLHVRNLRGVQGETMENPEGETIIFWFPAEGLSEVFVYPNPVKYSDEGCYFARLPAKATVKIYTANYHLIRILKEEDADGGVFWDLRDAAASFVAPGVYIYEVTTPEGGRIYGKLAIVAP